MDVRRDSIPFHPKPRVEPTASAEARYDVESVREVLPALVDALSDAIVVLDRGRRVVAANRRYMQVFGVTGPDVAGVTCDQSLRCP
ncbi:MAG TPA: PAS domain-containing protein, partial [Dongiaceae bacterium]|nr:PAS domain-containing protein [Dongiaceae bacterium]